MNKIDEGRIVLADVLMFSLLGYLLVYSLFWAYKFNQKVGADKIAAAAQVQFIENQKESNRQLTRIAEALVAGMDQP